jgi:hypothetical protein
MTHEGGILERDLSDLLCVTEETLQVRRTNLGLVEGEDWVRAGKHRAIRYTDAGRQRMMESFGLEKTAQDGAGGYFDPAQPHTATPEGAGTPASGENGKQPIVVVRVLRRLPNRRFFVVRVLADGGKPSDRITRMFCPNEEAVRRAESRLPRPGGGAQELRAIDQGGGIVLDVAALRRQGVR